VAQLFLCSIFHSSHQGSHTISNSQNASRNGFGLVCLFAKWSPTLRVSSFSTATATSAATEQAMSDFGDSLASFTDQRVSGPATDFLH